MTLWLSLPILAKFEDHSRQRAEWVCEYAHRRSVVRVERANRVQDTLLTANVRGVRSELAFTLTRPHEIVR